MWLALSSVEIEALNAPIGTSERGEHDKTREFEPFGCSKGWIQALERPSPDPPLKSSDRIRILE